MGLTSVVIEKTRLLVVAGVALTVAVGCQHQVAPVQLSVAADESSGKARNRAPAEQKDTPYFNPTWVEEEPTSDPVEKVVQKSATVIDDVFSPMVDVTTREFKRFSGENASQAIRLLEDPTSADNRRIGMNKLVEFGFLNRDTPVEKKTCATFEKRCREITQMDSDFTVRATAIRTGNRGRDAQATSLFIKNLNDKNELVRLEAAKALANVPDINAAATLITVITDREETRDVRIAAVDALKHYRTLPVERALCSMLHDRSFAVAWQARRSLEYLTSRDFRYDEAAWLNYFAGEAKAM